jgi:hypothetical protein
MEVRMRVRTEILTYTENITSFTVKAENRVLRD